MEEGCPVALQKVGVILGWKIVEIAARDRSSFLFGFFGINGCVVGD
jgi:hypothetical protein